MEGDNEILFLFGVHGHQPQGNLPWVIEGAFERAYKPFIEAMRAHPEFAFSLHYSGPLWEWIEKERPYFLDWIGEMVERGQLEIQVSGFYEPVLASIPPEDQLGQIEMSIEYVKTKWGVRPQGLWLTERVWEPQILPGLIESGIRYVLVDDYHFLCAGVPQEKLGGYFLTEEGGKTMAIFPISERLRYLVPFRPVKQVMEYLKDCPGPGAILYDDAEKFGVWPGTHDWVYKEGWLNRFLNALASATWLKTRTFSSFMDKHPPQGRAYLPTASYLEMGEWSLPAPQASEFHRIVEELKRRGDWERYRPYIRGGIWKHFLIKYPEANHMHKRMIWTSKRLKKKGEAKRALYKAQCNDAYWHGIFGGIYLPHLRRSVFHHLLEAERLSKEALCYEWRGDMDADGYEELVLSNTEYLAVIKPSYGGALVELDLRLPGVNITDTLARRFEHYHRGMEGEEEEGTPSIHKRAKHPPKEDLIYDPLPRYSFLDSLIMPGETIEDWQRGRLQGKRLGDQPYRHSPISSSSAKMHARGDWGFIEKVYRLKDGLLCQYKWGFSQDWLLAVEINLHMPWAQEARVSVGNTSLPATEARDWGPIEEWSCLDPSLPSPVVLKVEGEATLWQVPFFTVSQSEGGFDRIYQGTGFLLLLRGTRANVSIREGE